MRQANHHLPFLPHAFVLLFGLTGACSESDDTDSPDQNTGVGGAGGASASTAGEPGQGGQGTGGQGQGGQAQGGQAEGGQAEGGQGQGGQGQGGQAQGGQGAGGQSTTDDRDSEAGVCARWLADRADMSEGTWSGSVASCDPGDISPEGRANALRLFNLYRWLAHLPAVETTPTLDAMAQACALLQTANDSLSHNPPESWDCWTELGAEGASTSNISGGAGVESVDLYMVDYGNESTFGHRRIILGNRLGPIGLGSTGPGGSSCMQNMSGTGDAESTFTPWPPAGIVPVEMFRINDWLDLDQIGWSVQSEDIELSLAEVTVTANGTPVSVSVSVLDGNYGFANALRIVPEGWTTEANVSYRVVLDGLDTPLEYTVEVVDCS